MPSTTESLARSLALTQISKVEKFFPDEDKSESGSEFNCSVNSTKAGGGLRWNR
jgi:hypothetical protein